MLNRRDVLRTGLALSSSPLFSRIDALFDAAAPAGGMGGRERLLLDFGWKFFQGHGTDPRHDLGFGKGQGDFAKSGDFGFATERFDDSKWRTLNLPHDWAVELPFVHDESAARARLQAARARAIRRPAWAGTGASFDIPEGRRGRACRSSSTAPSADALVFLNGYFIGRNDNGYAPFCLRPDRLPGLSAARTTLVVRMDASFGDGWFYEGAGIYRHVWLTKTDAAAPGPVGELCAYRRSQGRRGGTLSLGTVVQNDGKQAEHVPRALEDSRRGGEDGGDGEAAPQTIAADGCGELHARRAKLPDAAAVVAGDRRSCTRLW